MQKDIDQPTYSENHFIRIRFIPEKNYIEEVWKDFGEDEEIVIAKTRFLEILHNTKAKAYLSDLRNFKGASPENQLWIRDVWFPEVYKAGLRMISYLVKEDIFANFSIETAIGGEYAKKIEMRKFITYEEAEGWLLNELKI